MRTRHGLALLGLTLPVLALGGVTEAPAESGSARVLFDRGMSAYEQGDFEAAIGAFSEILATGVDDPVVHYNLGNAWFKSGRLGFAIYHYRRAHALAPRDEDISANLEYARFLALDSLEEDGAKTDLKVEGWLDRTTPEEAYRFATLLWVLAGTAGVVWQLSSRGGLPWRRFFVVLLAIWAVSFAGAWTVERRTNRVQEAVVFPRETEVKNGPGVSFETAFVLHEGAEVVVEGERGSWTEISIPGDLRGWISSDAIGRL
jgi:hypothetical protein